MPTTNHDASTGNILTLNVGRSFRPDPRDDVLFLLRDGGPLRVSQVCARLNYAPHIPATVQALLDAHELRRRDDGRVEVATVDPAPDDAPSL